MQEDYSDTTLANIKMILDNADVSTCEDVNISIMRNITVETIEAYIKYLLLQSSLNAKISFGDYDVLYQDAVGGNAALLNGDTHCVCVFLFLNTLSPMLTWNFTRCSTSEQSNEIKRIEVYIDSVLKGIRKQTDALILWHSFENPLYPAYGMIDSQVEYGQLSVFHALSTSVRAMLQSTPNAILIDMNVILNRIGGEVFYDSRYWHIGKAPYSRRALQEIAFENAKAIRALKGKNKKCLVLDCDNTLWGGIVGEDGVSGIKLGTSYPGSAFYEFQQEIIKLFNRGIIIALCSKNNEDDVLEVFQHHPDMLLKETHIATHRINWEDKASNIRAIAEDLNIGLDSVVFVDDSEFEINLVNHEFPEVVTLHLPKGKSVDYRRILAACGLFDTLTLSLEDKNRGAMYRAEVGRKKLKAQATDLTSYYKSLEMVVDIRYATKFTIPRVAQQTQKTNQFNLTTRRYNESEIQHFAERPDSDVFTLKLADRFGDSGIVGTCILLYETDKAVIDTLLLSCRILGRGVEEVFVHYILKHARNRKCKTIIGEYTKTTKNMQVEFFYSKMGFVEMNSDKAHERRLFEFDLTQPIKERADYFKEVISEV